MDQSKLQECVLCNLQFNRWTASAKLPKELLGDDVPKEIVRGMQDLIPDRTLLKDIATIRRTAKGELMRNSVPFHIDGIWLVPKELVTGLDDRFTELGEEDKSRVEKFLKAYPKLKTAMKKKYPKYYRKDKLPSTTELRKRFNFSWQFFQLTLPDPESGILDPKLYKREVAKVKRMVADIEEMTLNLVANRLTKRIKKLSSQCENGKINKATVDSVDRFLDKWDELWSGFVDDKRMRTIMASMKRQMKSASADRLKDNEDFREKVGDKLDNVISKLKKRSDLHLKRRLDI
jgi:hypothetical protein